MKTTLSPNFAHLVRCGALAAFLTAAASLPAQTLINVDFGVGSASSKKGPAATGMGTNDFWNLYRHYDPKYVPGMPLVANGKLDKLKLADGTETEVGLSLSNAPGVWGNASGDPMYDTYIFSQNGSHLTVALSGLPPGRYHFYLYGHADADVIGEQNSLFTLKAGTNTFGPLASQGSGGWKAAHPWQEGAQYVVFRDVPVERESVVIEAAAGPNGVAVLNGLQIISRGTSPPRLPLAAVPETTALSTNLWFRDLRYEGKVSDTEARFVAALEVESLTTNEISAPLFEGELALVARKLPEGLRIAGRGRQMRLYCAAPGTHRLELELIAKITRMEPWNQISFVGPPAAMASLTVQASRAGVEMQLLSGTQIGEAGAASAQTSQAGEAAPPLRGFLGSERAVVLRWQSKAAEVARKPLITVDTAASAQLTPTVVKFTTVFRYEMLQAAAARLMIELPATQALTRLQGEQIRDWQLKPEGERQILTVQFIKPVEKSCALTLFSEQTVPATPLPVQLVPPQPLEVEREAGSFTLSADDTTVEIGAAPGLRQVNPPAGALAAYRFSSRPVAVAAKLQRTQPLLKLADRVTARLEETRLLVSHALDLEVEKAGIYALDLTPQPGLVVSEVKGEGLDDWKASEGKLRISFSSRVLGARKLQVQLEQANKEFPQSAIVLPLAVAGVTNAAVQVGAVSSPGIRLKTIAVAGLREVSIASLTNRVDEWLGFAGEQPDWKLTLGAERLSARIVAEVFNLVAVGDGLVGGSATIRYGILNQGAQQFRIAVPAHWRNLEFTGANIRRKEQQTNLWTITLQDKAWDGYTLVLTYDYQFDPNGSTLDLAGAHPLGVERETGSLGVMTAASLNLTAAPTAEPLRRVDETELPESDRALCLRPLLLAYKYTGGDYRHSVQVTRFEELPVLDAVADRTELTTVLTEAGQLLTQSSFMVKNNEKQFQRFQLPKGAKFWSSFVNGQPAKPEQDGQWLLVPLPRQANRDLACAVDIVYAQKLELRASLFPRQIELAAPLTDIPNTYAEWQLFAPVSQRLSGFGGNMTVGRGTTYELRDAWQGFIQFYGNLIEQNAGLFLFCLCAMVLVVLIVASARRGVGGAVVVLAVLAILAILSAMMLPALSRAKARAQSASAMNNLKEIGIALKTWGLDNNDALPPSLQAMTNELASEKVTIDPNTGQPFVYVGAGKSESNPEAILAYSPSDANGRAVLFADGSVQVLTPERFQEALQRDAALPRNPLPANRPATTPPPEQGQQVATAGSARAGRLFSPPPASRAASPSLLGASPNAAPAPPAPATGLPQGMGGGMGGGGGAPAQDRPTAAGVRPIRIEVPRTGQAFGFTKVLNAGQEPLTVRVRLMPLKVYRTVQMILQVCAFSLGLLLLWRLAAHPGSSSFWKAVAAALIIWSVARLLTLWRLLHVGLILTVPALLFGLAAWAAWKWRKHYKGTRASRPSGPPPAAPPGAGQPAVPPVAALIAFLALALWAGPASAQDATATAISNSVSIVSATYTGAVNDKVAEFDATLLIATAATNQFVPLFGPEAAIRDFAAQGNARLILEGRTVGVRVPGRANITLQFKLVAKLGGDVTRRQLAFGIPPALASRVSLVIDEPEADVDFPAAVAIERSSTNQQTRVEAVLGMAERLELNWRPRVKRAAEIAPTVFVQQTALVTLGSGVMNVRAVLDYQVSQGEMRQARLQIPAGHRLLRVESDSMRTWEVKDDLLVVDWLKGVSPGCKLSLETEKVLGKLPATVKIEIPRALDVKRETGLVAVRASEELSLTVEQTRDLQRVDVEEFRRVLSDKPEGMAGAFRFLTPDFVLSVSAGAVQPQLEAVARHTIRLGPESVRVSAQLDYTIKRAGVFALQLALPAGYRLETLSGNNVSQWAERGENGARVVEATLKERTLGAYTLNLLLSRSFQQPPKSLSIETVHPLELQKLTGFITVAPELGLAVKTESFEGLAEIPINSAGPMPAPPQGPAEEASATPQGSALAFKFIAAAPEKQPSWKLSVTTEAVEPWVRAELMNTITIAETLVSGRTQVKYDIANAPVKEFRLRVPAAFKNVEISGAQVRRRDETNGEWRVELQSKVRSGYRLTVTWELPGNEKTNVLELTGVQTLGVEREAGFVAVIARPPLQVTDKSGGEFLSRIDARELPEWPGRPDAAMVLAYRYLRPGYTLAIEARRFEQAEVLQALIDSARLATVVADDGQMMTAVTLNVRNNGRQHLGVELPPQATVWSAFVAGEPVRPSRNQGKLLLPLARDVGGDTAVTVELTYIGRGDFPAHHGAVSLRSPSFDIPLKNAHWDLFLPPDYEYSRFEGSMNRATEAGAPVIQVYSLSEYNVQQQAQEVRQQLEMRYGLKDARENLSGGNLRQALSSFNRTKSKGQQFKPAADEERDLKVVEQDLRNAQGSNLILAQNNFSVENSLKFGDQQILQVQRASAVNAAASQQAAQPAAQAEAPFLNYDADVAGRQWEKLEKAQQVAVPRIVPLRVNLPTRGVRYSFAQVLQTETLKPMTIRLLAQNTKVPSWTSRVALGLLSFAALWVLMALVFRPKPRPDVEDAP
jgi:type II secretory pathway pseudopilin PulG